MPRKLFWPVLVIGAALIVAPFAISLPSRASAGQTLLNDFHPIMQPASVRQTAAYYKVFTELRPLAIGGVPAAAEAPKLISALASGLHMTPGQVQQFLGKNFPAFASLLGAFPKLVPVFTKVPPGLDAFKPLVTTMQANVSNYAAVDSLPNFNLFTWFFVIPGALLVLLAAFGLGAFRIFARRRDFDTTHQVADGLQGRADSAVPYRTRAHSVDKDKVSVS